MQIIREKLFLPLWFGIIATTPSVVSAQRSRGNSCYYNGDYTNDGNSLVGPTDTCECNDGKWENCYKNTYDDDDSTNNSDSGRNDGGGGAIVGNDRDAYGCVGSAGYEWCSVLCQCIRPWETKCEEEFPVFVVCSGNNNVCSCVSASASIGADYSYNPVLNECVKIKNQGCPDHGGGGSRGGEQCCINGRYIEDGNTWTSETETCLCLDGKLQDCYRRCRSNHAGTDHGQSSIVDASYGKGQELCTCYDGDWVGCHSIYDNNNRSCQYDGKYTPHGFKLEGHDEVCECNDGHWENCYVHHNNDRCYVDNRYIDHGEKYENSHEICTCYEGQWWHECHPINCDAYSTRRPTRRPVVSPTRRPSSGTRTEDPTTFTPTTMYPTTFAPTREEPNRRPSPRPTRRPVSTPTHRPSPRPTGRPSRRPTRFPSRPPTRFPTYFRPTPTPFTRTTARPTNRPSRTPTKNPTKRPSPSTEEPTTFGPTTLNPTTFVPSQQEVTRPAGCSASNTDARIDEILCSLEYQNLFSSLCRFQDITGLTDLTSDTSKSYTIFAPINSAFENKEGLRPIYTSEYRQVLETHMSNRTYAIGDLDCDMEIEMSNREQTTIQCHSDIAVPKFVIGKGNTDQIDDERLLPELVNTIGTLNIPACNGIIHAVTNLIRPSRGVAVTVP